MTACYLSRGRRALRAELKKAPGASAALAERIGVSRSTISELASGEHTPSLEVAVKLEAAGVVACAAWFEFDPSNTTGGSLSK